MNNISLLSSTQKNINILKNIDDQILVDHHSKVIDHQGFTIMQSVQSRQKDNPDTHGLFAPGECAKI